MSARTWLVRFTSLFRKPQLEAELEEDVRMHLQLSTEENIRRGMSPEEAAAAARRGFGGLDQMKEQYRQERGIPVFEVFQQDVRFSLRSLGRTPLYAVIAILTIALGVGANTAIFSVVHGILVKRLPYADADRLSMIVLSNPQQNLLRMPLSVADYLDWREQNRAFDMSAAYGDQRFNLTGDSSPEQVIGAVVTAGFFDVLGARPALGRTFTADEDKPGSTPAVVISHSLWQRRFQGASETIGRPITLNGRAYPVVGVMPASFDFGTRGTEVWRTLTLDPPPRRGPYFLWAVGHLKNGVTLEEAQAQLQTIAQRIEANHPKENARIGFVTTPLQEYLVGSVRMPLYVLLGAVLFVLLIASANVGHLMLARAASREREIAVRAALGASRWRLTRQLLTESLVLATIGGAFGMALAWWGTAILKQIGPEDIPRLEHVTMDASVLLYTVAAALLSALLFGCVPALQTAFVPVNDSLKNRGGGFQPGGHRRLRNAVIVAEVALSLMLLVGAGLMTRSFLRLQQADPGFSPAHVLAARITVNRTRYPAEEQLLTFYDDLDMRIRRLPGVVDVGFGNSLPPNQLELTDSFSIEGRPWPKEQGAPIGPVLFVSPGYFTTLGIPIVRGRNFTVQDRLNTGQVTVISESLAGRYFGNEDPIGKRIKVGGPERPTAPWMEIVGVVGDAKYSSLEGEFEPTRYQTIAQVPWIGVHLVVKTTENPLQMVPAIKQELAQLDSEVPLTRIGTMDTALHEAVGQQRFQTVLLGVFAGVALLLATGGIYGVMSYSVSRRTQEIGIRVSLGARRRDVMRMIIGEGLLLGIIGIALGLMGAAAVTGVLRTLLFEVTPTDPITFTAVAGLLLTVMFAACYLPARRATLVDPLVALKCD